jgi:hypothetical protein
MAAEVVSTAAAEAAFEVVAVAADGDPILGLSTRSSCSATSTTALASIASFIMEAKKTRSELSRRRCKGLSRRRSCRDDYLRVFYNKFGLKFQTYGSSFEKQNLNADDEATA